MGAGFDSDRLVDDIALNARTGGQANFQPANLADNAAIDDNIIGHNLAVDRGAFADGQEVRMDVALDFAFDLNVTAGADVALDPQIR